MPATPDGSPAGAAAAAGGQTPRSARELLDRGRAFLLGKGLEEGRLEAELLCAHALGLERLQLFLELERPVSAAEIDLARDLLVRRAGGEPTAYLIGEREFYARAFNVSSDVLVPRPETELLVDRAREWAGAREWAEGAPAVLDLGTGSGAIAITLALELPGATVVASDVSEPALALAAENASRLRPEGGAPEFVLGDGFEPFLGGERRFDLIVSNPPYIRPDESASLPVEVREFEPHLALFAPEGDPDHWVGRVVRQGLPLLNPGGLALIELGHEQAASLGPKLAQRGLVHRFVKDLGGIERMLELPAVE